MPAPTIPHGFAFVLGTRPEMVKMAPVIRELGPDARVFHTGQHFDAALSGNVWSALGLPAPELTLDAGGAPRATQIGETVVRLGETFSARPPRAVVVQGDTNATLAGALAANANGIPLVHVEAGLRSRDRAMPEEHNRVMVDHLSDLLCAPTTVNRDNLLDERIGEDRILLTGNTVVEAVREQLPAPEEQLALVAGLGLTPDGYVLATIHRPENTDDLSNLGAILDELRAIDAPVLLPLHPRTRQRIERAGWGDRLGDVHVVDPLPPRDFLGLAARSALLVSDSGGLQEECSVLKRPLIVVRRSTERPEVMGTFAVRMTPFEPIAAQANEWLSRLGEVHAGLERIASPYGDGRASERIARALARFA